MKIFGQTTVKFCLAMAVAAVTLSAGCENSEKKISAEKPEAPAVAPQQPLPANAYLPLEEISPEVVFKSFPQTQLPENDSIKQTVGKLLTEGLKFQAQGKTDEALRKYESARMYAPDSPRVLKALGTMWMVKRNYEKAANYYRMSLDVDPDDLQVQVNLGRVYLMQDKPEEALYCFRAALKTRQAKPQNVETAYAVLYRSRLLEKLGYYTASLQSYAELQNLVRENWGSYQKDSVIGDFVMKPERFMIARGNLYDQLREPQKALEEYKKALARDRNEIKVGIKVFELYVQLGEYRQAEALLGDFAKQDVYANYLGKLAITLSQKSLDPDQPLRMWKKYRRHNTVLPVFAFALAGAADSIKAWEQEKAILTDVLSSMPDAPKAAEKLAELAIKDSNPQECLECMAELIVSNNKAFDGVQAAMKVIAAQPEAMTILDKYLEEKSSGDAGLQGGRLYVAAVLAGELHQDDRSTKLLEEAIKIFPKFAPAYVSLMNPQWMEQNPQKTDAMLKLMKENVTGVDYYYVLGSIELVRGRYPKAIKSLEKARELDEANELVIMKLSHAYELEARKTTDPSVAARYNRDNERLLQTAIELRPDKLDAYEQLFEKYVNRLDAKRSADIAVQVIKNLPQNPEGPIMAAETYLMANSRRRAKSIIDDISKRWPDDPRIKLLQIKFNLGEHKGLISKKSFDENYAALKKLISSNPDFAPAYELGGRLLGMVMPADYPQAIKYMSTACRLDPENFSYAREYMMLLIRAGDYKTALPLAESLHGQSPRSITLKQAIISCLEEMGNHAKALEYLEAWHKAMPENKVYSEWMLRIYVAQKQYGKAIALLDELRNMGNTPNYPQAWINDKKFEVYMAQKDFAKAFDVVKAGLTENDMKNIVLLIDALADDKKYDQALEYVSEMQKRIPQDEKDEVFLDRVKALRYYVLSRADRMTEFMADLAKEKPEPGVCNNVYAALMSGKHYKEALELLNKWQIRESFNPENKQKDQINSWCREMTVATYLAMYDFDKATKALEDSMAEDDDKSWYYYYRAHILMHKGQDTDAALVLQKALEKDPKNPMLKNDLAYQLAVIGRELKLAEKLARQCLQQKGFEPAYMDTLAWVFYKANQSGRAAELLLKIVPTPQKISAMLAEAKKQGQSLTAEEINPVIVEHLADILDSLGWDESAREYWQAAAELAEQWPVKTRDIEDVIKHSKEKLKSTGKKKQF